MSNNEDHNLPHAPDSMKLRGTIIRAAKLNQWNEEKFARAQEAIRKLRDIRETLQFLGLNFQDTP